MPRDLKSGTAIATHISAVRPRNKRQTRVDFGRVYGFAARQQSRLITPLKRSFGREERYAPRGTRARGEPRLSSRHDPAFGRSRARCPGRHARARRRPASTLAVARGGVLTWVGLGRGRRGALAGLRLGAAVCRGPGAPGDGDARARGVSPRPPPRASLDRSRRPRVASPRVRTPRVGVGESARRYRPRARARAPRPTRAGPRPARDDGAVDVRTRSPERRLVLRRHPELQPVRPGVRPRPPPRGPPSRDRRRKAESLSSGPENECLAPLSLPSLSPRTTRSVRS